MIVITIIFILIGIAAARYDQSVTRAKEATLKTDLTVMWQAIDNYTLDKEAAPQSLDDLANPQAPYFARSSHRPDDTSEGSWHTDYGDLVLSPDQTNKRDRGCAFQLERGFKNRRQRVQHLVVFPENRNWKKGNRGA